MNILFRRKKTINIDPLRRCYDGCHKKTAVVWLDPEKINARLSFWRGLNFMRFVNVAVLPKLN